MPAWTEHNHDHERDLAKHEPSPRHQKRAVSELVGYCYGLSRGGALTPEIEKQLMARVRNACVEFGIDPPTVMREGV